MNTSEPQSPRIHGLKWMALGTLAIIVAVLVSNWLLPKIGFELGIGGLFAFGACGVYFLLGLTEVITNRPFIYWAQKWMDLKGWQRGVFGTLFLLLVLAALIAIIPFVA
jgi:hypothetical protein